MGLAEESAVTKHGEAVAEARDVPKYRKVPPFSTDTFPFCTNNTDRLLDSRSRMAKQPIGKSSVFRPRIRKDIALLSYIQSFSCVAPAVYDQ